MTVYDIVKKAVQEVLAPDLQEIKGELKSVNVRLDAVNERFDDLTITTDYFEPISS